MSVVRDKLGSSIMKLQFLERCFASKKILQIRKYVFLLRPASVIISFETKGHVQPFFFRSVGAEGTCSAPSCSGKIIEFSTFPRNRASFRFILRGILWSFFWSYNIHNHPYQLSIFSSLLIFTLRYSFIYLYPTILVLTSTRGA